MSPISTEELCSIMEVYPDNIQHVHQRLRTAAKQHAGPNPFTFKEIVAVLTSFPNLTGGWWQWSGDKRRAGWFFTSEPDGTHKVGLSRQGVLSDIQEFKDKVLACATFILKELEWEIQFEAG